MYQKRKERSLSLLLKKFTLITDIDAVGTGDHFSDLILILSAEGTSDLFLWSYWHVRTSILNSLCLAALRHCFPPSRRPVLVAGDHAVDQTVCGSFLGCHVVVSLCVAGNHVERLSGVCSQDLVELLFCL